MLTPKKIFAAAVFGLLMPAYDAVANDGLSCKATVTYDGQTYTVRESARTQAKVRHKLLDEACDKVCGTLHGAEEDACEQKCEATAEIATIECTGKENPKPDSKKKSGQGPKKKQYCSADVSYDGKNYSVKEHAKSKEKAERKLIREACEVSCISLSGRAEDECERSCKKSAKILSIQCKEKTK